MSLKLQPSTFENPGTHLDYGVIIDFILIAVEIEDLGYLQGNIWLQFLGKSSDSVTLYGQL